MGPANNAFNLYRSYLLKTHEEDRIAIEVYRKCKKSGIPTKSSFKLHAINMNYLSLTGNDHFDIDEELSVKLSIKSFLNRWEIYVDGRVIRSFHLEEGINYGVMLQPNIELKYFLKEFVSGFSSSRLKDSLIHSSLSEKKYSMHDGIEIYATLVDFYQQLLNSKSTLDLQKCLQEFCKVIDAEEANIYLINTSTQKLENIVSTRGEKYKHCDYRYSLLGESFTTQESINYKGPMGQEHSSFLITPFHNQMHHVIGVIELKNKLDHERFSHREDRGVKLLSAIIGNLYHDYNPISGNTKIEEFNNTLKLQRYYNGLSQDSLKIDRVLKKMAMSGHHLLFQGEKGLGKISTINKIIKKGILADHPIDRLDFSALPAQELNKVEWNEFGSLIFQNIHLLGHREQKLLYEKINFGKRRVFTVSHIDLETLANQNKIYQPLFKLLSKMCFSFPPLRHRKNELISLAIQVLHQECERRNDPIERTLSPQSLLQIEAYTWPGNLAEMEKVIRKALLIQPNESMLSLDIPKVEAKQTLTQELSSLRDNSYDSTLHYTILTELLGEMDGIEPHEKFSPKKAG